MRRVIASSVLVFALAACGGGGAGSGGSSLPAAPSPPLIPAPSSGGTQSVTVAIVIPSTLATAGANRRPAYVSGRTQSVSIAVNGGTAVTANLAAGAPACSTSSAGRTCSVVVSAPIGTDTFSEKLYATTNGTGAVLSQGTISATVAAGKSNTVNLTLDGVPASIVLVLANSAPVIATKTSIALTVTVKDASGLAIIGADPFLAPITLTDSDSSGATSLSKTTLSSPADAANLSVTYTGAALSSAVFGASAGGVAPSNVVTATLTPHAAGPATSFNDYTTFGYDNQRDVFNPNSAAITPASIANIHVAWQAALGGGGDYNTQTQPVLATNVAGHDGLLFVGGGGSGYMYGYDALTGALVWQQNLGVETYTCAEGGAINFGIGGTAAYEPASKSLYVVGNSNTQADASGKNDLFHLDAATGAVLGSVNFAPSSVGPTDLNFSHTSVALGSNGLAYVGTAATCDISSWRGRVAAVSVPSMTLANTFYTVWNPPSQAYGGGGVWGWGGVSLDFAGNVFTGVGNTDNGTTANGKIVAPFMPAPFEDSGNGEAFIKLSPDLSTLAASHHPIPETLFYSTSLAADLDVNGTPVILNPRGAGCDTLAALQSKSGSLYVYDTTRISSGPVAQYLLAPPTYGDEFIGDPAYSPATGLLYAPVPVGAGTLYPAGMIAIDPGCGSPSVAWHTTFGPDSDVSAQGFARSVPAVSAGGVVFVGTPCAPDANGGCAGDPTKTTAAARSTASVRKPALCCAPPGNTIGGALWALDASNGAVLNGGKPLLTTPGVIRVPPTIDGNWVFVLDNGGDMYGMTLDAKYAAVAAKYRTVDARSRRQWEPPPARPHR